MLAALLIATAHGEPPPPPPAAPGNLVAPNALEAQRIAGTKQIAPDDQTKREIARAAKDKTVSSFKLCVTVDGAIASVRLLKSSGFPAYDQKIIDTIQREWRYKPFSIEGKPVPVCTAVTFIYTQQPADPPPTLTLLKPGKEPRQVLRMSFKQGDTHNVVIHWQDSTARGDQAPEKSAMRYELAYAVGDVDPSGDARIDVTYRKIELGSTDADSQTFNAKLAKLAGTKAHATITARGVVKDFELAPEVPASLEKAFGLVALRPIDESLPDEPVGVGAAWEVARTVTSGDIVFALTTSYLVTAIDGSRVTLKVSYDGKAGTSDQATTHLTGKSEAVIDLRDAVPISVKLDVTQDTELGRGTSRLSEHSTSIVTMTAR